MKTRSLVLAACLSLLSATASTATTFTVGGDDFDVTTITGTFADNRELLEGQVWFGSTDLAALFVSAVGFDLGLFSNPAFLPTATGPLFATSFGGTFDTVRFSFTETGQDVTITGLGDDVVATFAIAQPTISAVPLPAGGLLLLSGLAGVAGLKRRKKRAA